MTRVLMVALLLALGGELLLVGQQAPVPEIPFDVTEPLELPDDLFFGEIAGVALNSERHVFVYTRTGGPGASILQGERAQLFEFGPDGRFIREIGRNLYSKAWAHAVRVDRDDNIWLVDNGSDLVVKLGPDRRLELTLGRRDEAVLERLRKPPIPADAPISPARPGYFFEPTDVAFDVQGNIFVSDGYINSHVHKFDRDGHIVKMVGDRKAAGPGQFEQPHGIAVDNEGRVYVADRSNHRIQVLDNDLNYVREIRYAPPLPRNYKPPIPAFGSHGNFHTLGPWFWDNTWPDGNTMDTQWETLWPNTLCITPGPTQYIYAHDMFPGSIQKFTLDGELLGTFGEAGRRPGQFGWLHSLACVSENEIWTGELLNWRVQKFILKPGATAGASMATPSGSPFVVTRLVPGPDGMARVQNVEMALTPGSGAAVTSQLMAATGLSFQRMAADDFGEWHPTPTQKYSITLAGAIDIEVGEGRRVRVGPGNVLLPADNTGKGHRNHRVSDEPRLSAQVHLTPEPSAEAAGAGAPGTITATHLTSAGGQTRAETFERPTTQVTAIRGFQFVRLERDQAWALPAGRHYVIALQGRAEIDTGGLTVTLDPGGVVVMDELQAPPTLRAAGQGESRLVIFPLAGR